MVIFTEEILNENLHFLYIVPSHLDHGKSIKSTTSFNQKFMKTLTVLKVNKNFCGRLCTSVLSIDVTFVAVISLIVEQFWFKLGSAVFLFFTKWWIALQKLWKMLFDLKSTFRFWDIQIFVFSSSSLFYPVSHCFRGWFKKNLKVYDAMNFLNKNLITHFVWYLEKEKRYAIETLSLIEY